MKGSSSSQSDCRQTRGFRKRQPCFAPPPQEHLGRSVLYKGLTQKQAQQHHLILMRCEFLFPQAMLKILHTVGATSMPVLNNGSEGVVKSEGQLTCILTYHLAVSNGERLTVACHLTGTSSQSNDSTRAPRYCYHLLLLMHYTLDNA